MGIVDTLKWRYSTKKFDSTKKIKDSDLEYMKEAIVYSASSFGLQLYKIIVVSDPKIREQLLEHSWGQKQIIDASHLLVFCTLDKDDEKNTNEFIQLKSKTQGVPEESLSGYGDFIKSYTSGMSEIDYKYWTDKQVYIALGNLLVAAGELKIDACPMEGFVKEKYDEVLGLKEKGLKSSVVATIGYRSEEDATQNAKKVRKSKDLLFEEI